MQNQETVAFVIDPEIKSIIPPLRGWEKDQLEESLLLYGCRDKLIVWQEGGILLDGHNRYEICEKHGIPFDIREESFDSIADAMVWVIDNQFARRNLTDPVRFELIQKKREILAAKGAENEKLSMGRGKKGLSKNDKPIDPHNTQAEIAKTLGWSTGKVAQADFVRKHAPEKWVEKGLQNPEPNAIGRLYKEVKEGIQKKRRQEERSEAAKNNPISDSIIVGDFREHADRVADGSLSLIFTDPPYDRGSIDLFDGIGEFASKKLCEGGSLVCYVGHIQLFDAMATLRKYLRQWWVICCLHSGGASLMREYGIRAGWKPVLWLVKGTRDDKECIVSDVMSGGREKDHHDWQQSQSEAEYWIENLCPPDGIVCDPFLGGGTTAAAANAKGRKWIGYEINPEQAAIASKRIS